MNANMKLLFVFTGLTVLTLWFAEGLLNPFIKAAASIIFTALLVLFKFFFGWIGIVLVKITKPFRNIHFPPFVKALLYFLFGAMFFVLDQIYGKQLFELDETILFYHVHIGGWSFWISKYAIMIGGFFIFISACYMIGIILRGLNKLLDHPVHISIVINR